MRALLLLVASVAFGAVKVGDVPPEIRLEQLMPEGASIAAIKGKAVVVHLWATWCGPCIADIPKWNALVDQFQGKNVAFLAISDENPALIGRFLVKFPIHGWVGIGKTRQAWELEGVGHKFLIGADGKIVADATGKILTPAAIDDLIAGRPVKLAEVERYVTKLRNEELGSATPVADVIIRPTTVADGRGGTGRGKDELLLRAMPVRNILSVLFLLPPNRIVGGAVEDPTRYDAWIALPGASRDQFEAFARAAVCAGLHVTAEKETRDTDVYILTAPNGDPPGRVKEETFGGRFMVGGGADGVIRTRGPLIGITAPLERALGAPVLDETKIEGMFDINVKYTPGSRNAAIEAVEKLGLKLTKARRPMEFLVVKRSQ
jgi:uncharacterized protein (TIGR03435 family)